MCGSISQVCGSTSQGVGQSPKCVGQSPKAFLPKGIPQGHSQGHSSSAKSRHSQDVPRASPKAFLPKAFPKGTHKGIPQVQSQGIPKTYQGHPPRHSYPRAFPKGLTRAFPKCKVKAFPRRTKGTPQGIPILGHSPKDSQGHFSSARSRHSQDLPRAFPKAFHPQGHSLRAFTRASPKRTFLKCTFPSAHSQVHVLKCTFPSAHSQVHTPNRTFLKCTHTLQVHIPQAYIPKCTVTQNRCADRTGGLTPRSPTGGGLHEKRKQIKVHVKGNEKGRKKCMSGKSRVQGELSHSQRPILTMVPRHKAPTTKGHTHSGQRAVATRPSTEQEGMPHRGVVGTKTKGRFFLRRRS